MSIEGNIGDRDVNIHNADSGTGIRSEAESISVALDVEQKATLEAIKTASETVSSNIFTEGQKPSANSLSVVTASDHTVPANITKVSNAPLTLGQKTSASSIPVVLASDQSITVGSLDVGTIDVTVPPVTITGDITSISSTVVLELQGRVGVSAVISGVFEGSLVAQVSADNQSSWMPANITIAVAGTTTVSAISVKGPNTFQINGLDGITHVRVLPNSFTIGIASVTITATAAESILSQSLVSLDTSSSTVAGFSRLRVANPYSLFDSQHVVDSQMFFWETNTATGGTATFLPNEAAMLLTIGPSSGSKSQRRTKERFRYQAARAHQVISTGVLGSATANVYQKIGYYDDLNGVYFQQSPTGPAVVMRSYVTGSVVETVIPQSSWNIDKFDGTGPSGQILDCTKANIFYIELEWLGVGAVRMGFSLNGVIYQAHKFSNSNTNTGVYIGTASLPVTYEILATADIGGFVSMKQICTSVVSEGGEEEVPFRFSASTGTTPVEAATASALMIIRPKLLLNGIANRVHIYPYEAEVYPVGGQPVLIRAVINPTIIGSPSWVAAHPLSGVEYTVSPGLTITGGLPLVTIIAKAGEVKSFSVSGHVAPIALDSSGTLQNTTLGIIATALDGITPVHVALNWQEDH